MNLSTHAQIGFLTFCQYDPGADDLAAKVNRKFIQSHLLKRKIFLSVPESRGQPNFRMIISQRLRWGNN